MAGCEQVAVPDPQLLRDAYLRQILVPLRKNQQQLAACVASVLAGSASAVAGSTASGSQFPVRAVSSPVFTATAVTGNATGSGAPTATDLPTVIALANANQAALNNMAGLVNQLVAQQAALVSDRDALAAQVTALQRQLVLLIKAVNS